MIRPRDISTSAVALVVAALFALPATAGAQSSATTGGLQADPNQPYLTAGAGVIVRRRATITGRLAGVKAGRLIDVQARRGSGAWVSAGSANAAADGSFSVTWRARHLGRYSLRALPHDAATSASADVQPSTTTLAHLAARATWFGPSDNGSTTACGVKLTTTVLGVAHRTLPCGTQVSILFKGREITVPVIDRGPYRSGVDWDMTQGTAAALNFTDTGLGTIGAVALRDEPLAALAGKH